MCSEIRNGADWKVCFRQEPYIVAGGGLRLQEEEELVHISGGSLVGLDPGVGLSGILSGDLLEGGDDVVLEGHVGFCCRMYVREIRISFLLACRDSDCGL